MSILFVHSHYGPVPAPFSAFSEEGLINIVRDGALDSGVIEEAQGIITTMHLDQVSFFRQREELSRFFNRGGHLFFNGHVLKPFVSGLETYKPLMSRRLPDFRLQKLVTHPVFGDLDPKDMVTRKGVAGFYGRGHNPLPKGARIVTGLGPLKQPIDWEWELPGGGRMFSHAGNDLWSMAPEESGGTRAFARRIVDWTAHKYTGKAA